jgi:hypothetical protein
MSRAVGSVSSNGFADKAIPGITQKLVGPTSTSNRLSWKDKFSRFVYGTLGFHSMYHMFDIGLSNFLALDILKHGTNIKSYLGISLRGADPKMGGSNQGVFSPGTPDCTNQFYVMPSCTGPNGLTVPPKYIQMASANLLGQKGSYSLRSRILGWCTPVLRFKFRPEDVIKPRFQKTNRIAGALFTTHSISPMRLGICGSLTQGIGLGMFRRMASNPLKVLSGVVLMGGAAYIGKRTYAYVTSKPVKKEEAPSPCDHSVQTMDPKSVKREINLAGLSITYVTSEPVKKEEIPLPSDHSVQTMDPKFVRRIFQIAGLSLLAIATLSSKNIREPLIATLLGVTYIGAAAHVACSVNMHIANRLTKKEVVLPGRARRNALDPKPVVPIVPKLNARILAVAGFCMRLYGASWLGVC